MGLTINNDHCNALDIRISMLSNCIERFVHAHTENEVYCENDF